MKIRLVDVDSKIPNLALMRISGYHKAKGDDVGWYNPILDYADTDILYMSKIFTFTDDYKGLMPINAKIIKGGTGYDWKITLPKEIDEWDNIDYSIYPNCDYSIQFLSRGCIRKCGFCIVNRKEGLIHNVKPTSLNPNGKYIMLLDNNFFGNPNWREQYEILKSYNQPVDFNSGVDLRILNEEQCKALAGLKIKTIHCAWDNYDDKDKILPKIKLLTQYVNPNKIRCYVLVGFKQKQIVEEDMIRVNTLWKEYKVLPFAMGYRNFEVKEWKLDQSVKDFCRWVNRVWFFKTMTFEEYKKSKGIKQENEYNNQGNLFEFLGKEDQQ